MPVELLKHFTDDSKLLNQVELRFPWLSDCSITGENTDSQDLVSVLKAAINWSVHSLAPKESPLSWTDPDWSHFLVLKHLYLEPLTPADYIEGGRRTATLMTRFGITSRGRFYGLRKKAFQRFEAAFASIEMSAKAKQNVQTNMLNNLSRKLSDTSRINMQSPALNLLGMASIFFRAFPAQALIKLATHEHLSSVQKHLDRLLKTRCIFPVDDGHFLIVPEPIRDYMLRQVNPDRLPAWHGIALEYCRQESSLQDRIRHMQGTNQHKQACDLIESNWAQLGSRCSFPEILQILDGFDRKHLSTDQWLWILVLRGSHLIRFGKLDQARLAFSRYLHGTSEVGSRLLALIFMAHICSNTDPDDARSYYQMAGRLLPEHPEFSQFYYSSYGRFHLSRRELSEAETCLIRAIDFAPHPHLTFRSVLLFALVDLYMLKPDLDRAQEWCNELLDYCHTLEDDHLIAMASGMQGKVALAQGDFQRTDHYLEKAIELHQKRSNYSEISSILRYKASGFVSAGRNSEAIEEYQRALKFDDMSGGFTRDLARTHLELAQLLTADEKWNRARHHWLEAWRRGKQLELDPVYFNRLRKLADVIPGLSSGSQDEYEEPFTESLLYRRTLELVQKQDCIRSSDLADKLGVCRTSAYHVLNRLLEAGMVHRTGKGRATLYSQPDSLTDEDDFRELDPSYKLVMQNVRAVGHITTARICRLLGVSRATGKRIASRLVKDQLLKRQGNGKSTRYVIS